MTAAKPATLSQAPAAIKVPITGAVAFVTGRNGAVSLDAEHSDGSGLICPSPPCLICLSRMLL